MQEMKRNKEYDSAIEFHKAVDLKWGRPSPNESWPKFLIEYYETLQ